MVGQALAGLLRYPTSVASDAEPTSLDDYVSRMETDADTIYYLVAQNRKVRQESSASRERPRTCCY